MKKPLLVIIIIASLSLITGFFCLVAFLVGRSLLIIRNLLLLGEFLPLFTEDLSDLAELDAWVLFANLLTVVVGKEHIGRETTLWSVWVLLALLLGLLGLTFCFLRHVDYFGKTSFRRSKEVEIFEWIAVKQLYEKSLRRGCELYSENCMRERDVRRGP